MTARSLPEARNRRPPAAASARVSRAVAPAPLAAAPGGEQPRPAWPARAAWGALGLAAVLLCWWLGTEALPAPDSLARRFGPTPTFASAYDLLSGSDLPLHILVSLRRVLVGLALAMVIGIPLGLAVGSWRRLEAALSPAMQFLRMISPLSWMPIAVMVFGVGDDPVYFLLTFAAVWPILLNTAAGVQQLDARWLLLARSVSATRWETLRTVVLPGVLGHVLTGVRLAIGILWIVLVPCEMLGVSAGMGYFILDTRDRLAYSELMAMVLLIGALGFLLDAAARSLYRLWRG
ncbi:ABC transporter permease [Pigmentiphaga soli]|uniref:ABC transporter permease n=1 Tax=Pigmentiphaga soli TaxID=1007095 RepID=A0ABP8HM62_9BURK